MKISTLGAVSAAFALCAVAGAQTAAAPVGASLRLGVFLPTNQDTIDATSSAIFAFGADYKLAYKPPTLGGYVSGSSLSVDYFNKDNYGNIPVLLNYLAMKDSWTLSVGAGVGFASLPSGNTTKFAYQVGLAYDLPVSSGTPFFVEGKFFGSENSRLNGFGVYVGLKF